MTTPPHTRVSRDDWVNAGRESLVARGAEHVRVAPLAASLGVARSSFYWYFADRTELMEALLDDWEQHNTLSLVDRAARPAATVTAAALTLFECWADPDLFDPRLEFAVRAWARTDDDVRRRLADADVRRLRAVSGLFRRHGFAAGEAVVRARVLWHSQIGMYALGVDEPTATRLRMLGHYVVAFCGQQASAEELADFHRFVRARSRRPAT